MKTSPQKAIRINCKECIYDPEGKGTWIEQVEACTITQCAFYEHRPLTSKTKHLRREKELELLTPAEREIVEMKRLARIQNIKDLQDRGLFQTKKPEAEK
jgi:hypothetical protein